MGDVGDAFNDWQKEKQAKKRKNLIWSTNELIRLGVEFESKNLGVHLIVKHGDEKIDFWPSTGKWINRKTGHTSRGIKNMLKHMGKT